MTNADIQRWRMAFESVDAAAREECAKAMSLPDSFKESIATTELIAEVDRQARKECAAIIATLAERPFDSEPEFSALMVAEAATRGTIRD
jgi:hypothetical protein